MEQTDYLKWQARWDAWEIKWQAQKEEKLRKKLLRNPNWKPKKKKRNPEFNPYNEYRETTSSSVYNKLHKHHNASCSYCKWHGGENDRNKWYHVNLEEIPGRKTGKFRKGEGRFPNWKLVSKNNNQWMKKPLKLEAPRSSHWIEGFDYNVEISWPMPIRPK